MGFCLGMKLMEGSFLAGLALEHSFCKLRSARLPTRSHTGVCPFFCLRGTQPDFPLSRSWKTILKSASLRAASSS
jgi:hypothetical protein